MKHVSTLTSATLKQTAAHGGCGECQTSCQSACKTSCTWPTRSVNTRSNRGFHEVNRKACRSRRALFAVLSEEIIK